MKNPSPIPPDTEKKEVAKQILALRLEKEFRCGDGTDTRSDRKVSHSINCNCKHLDEQISKLEQSI